MFRTKQKGIWCGPVTEMVIMIMLARGLVPSSRVIDTERVLTLFTKQRPGLIRLRSGDCAEVRRKPFEKWVRFCTSRFLKTKKREREELMARAEDAYAHEQKLAWQDFDDDTTDHPPPPCPADILDEPIEALGLPPRILVSLEATGIVNVINLTSKNAETILAIRGIGPEALRQIRGCLAEHDELKLAGDEEALQAKEYEF